MTDDEKKSGDAEGFKDQAELDDHAAQLSQIVMAPEADLSMAALQGYLLEYKKEPKKAVAEAGAWAEGLKKEQDEKAKKKEDRRREKGIRRAALLPPTPESQS